MDFLPSDNAAATERERLDNGFNSYTKNASLICLMEDTKEAVEPPEFVFL